LPRGGKLGPPQRRRTRNERAKWRADGGHMISVFVRWKIVHVYQ
jgi:hypothetical protein